MLRLLVGNIAPGTSDEELGEFLTKYGFPTWSEIEHVPGDGSRPAVMLAFGDISSSSLEKLSQRIHHMFWKGRELNAMIIGQYMP